jgi:hypothetical protein
MRVDYQKTKIMQNKVQELLKIEFRYDRDEEYHTKTITIGIYDTYKEAMQVGNALLDQLSNSFEVRTEDKFVEHHFYGHPKRLVTNIGYKKQKARFFISIVKLEYLDVLEYVDSI